MSFTLVLQMPQQDSRTCGHGRLSLVEHTPNPSREGNLICRVSGGLVPRNAAVGIGARCDHYAYASNASAGQPHMWAWALIACRNTPLPFSRGELPLYRPSCVRDRNGYLPVSKACGRMSEWPGPLLSAGNAQTVSIGILDYKLRNCLLGNSEAWFLFIS